MNATVKAHRLHPHRTHKNWVKYLVFTCLISLIPVAVQWFFLTPESSTPIIRAADSSESSPLVPFGFEILRSGELALIALILAAGTLGDAIMARTSTNENLKVFLCITAFVVYTLCFFIYLPCRILPMWQSLNADSVHILTNAQLFLLPVSVLAGCITQYSLIHELD